MDREKPCKQALPWDEFSTVQSWRERMPMSPWVAFVKSGSRLLPMQSGSRDTRDLTRAFRKFIQK